MSLGDRIKRYESAFDQRLMEGLPIVIRLDGKGFHNFTKGLKRPFDEGMHSLMVETTKELVDTLNASIGYTQSDEISIILKGSSNLLFDGRVNKFNSVLAGVCANFFNENIDKYIPAKSGAEAVFDCRCFNVPNNTEAYNYLIWRERDASKNSISMLAQSKFSHSVLQGKNGNQMQEMLFRDFGINWNNCPDEQKRGSFVKIIREKYQFSKDELNKLHPKHEARKNPEAFYFRNKVQRVKTPRLSTIENWNGFLFGNELPEEKK